MADLTKERLAELKRLHDAKEDLMMGSEEFHALIDMASRAEKAEAKAAAYETAIAGLQQSLDGPDVSHSLRMASEVVDLMSESAEARAREGR